MEFERVIRERRSIRAYTSDPVPEATIREILDETRWVPSWRNTQPWIVWVVLGEALERFRGEFQAAIRRDETPLPDLEHSREWPAACAARAAALLEARRASLDAAGEASDSEALLARTAGLFGAPCLLVFGFEDCLAPAYAAFDTGAFVLSVCLAAHNKGLGTCVSASLVRYPAILRGLLPGSVGKRLAIALTLGYPAAAADNTFERSRAPLDELVTWVR